MRRLSRYGFYQRNPGAVNPDGVFWRDLAEGAIERLTRDYPAISGQVMEALFPGATINGTTWRSIYSQVSSAHDLLSPTSPDAPEPIFTHTTPALVRACLELDQACAQYLAGEVEGFELACALAVMDSAAAGNGDLK